MNLQEMSEDDIKRLMQQARSELAKRVNIRDRFKQKKTVAKDDPLLLQMRANKDYGRKSEYIPFTVVATHPTRRKPDLNEYDHDVPLKRAYLAMLVHGRLRG